MKTKEGDFNNIVDIVYGLPTEYKEELKELLEHNLSEEHRDSIAANYKKAQAEEKAGKLKFSSDIKELKRMI